MNSPITEYQPNDLLKPFVELYWEGSFNTNKERLSLHIVPNGCVEMIIHLSDLHCNLHHSTYGWSQTPDYLVLGLFTQPYQVKFNTTVDVFAIRFKPEGIYNLFGLPSSMFVDSYEDMSLVLGRGFDDFCCALRDAGTTAKKIDQIEKYLLKTLTQQPGQVNYVNRAAELIRSQQGIKIKQISEQLSVSQRQLEREFKAKIGITPKRYLRLTRINEVMRLLNQHHHLSLTSVAYHCGCADQAHFIKDFKRITGEIPTMFVKERARFIARPGLSYYSD